MKLKVRYSTLLFKILLLPLFILSGLTAVCVTSGVSVASDDAITDAVLIGNDRLLIVRSDDAPAYQAVERSFRAQLSQHINQQSKKSFSIKSINLDSTKTLDDALFYKQSANNLTKKTTKNYDLIITIGARAAYDVLSRSPVAPVLSVFIPRQIYHLILDETFNPDGNQAVNKRLDRKSAGFRSAIYLDQPDERLVLLAKIISSSNFAGNGLKNNGLKGNSLANSPKVSMFTGPGRAGLLKTRQCVVKDDLIGIYSNTTAVMSDVSIHQEVLSSRYLKRALKRSDVIIATPKMVKQSPSVIKWMLYMAYQRNVPVIGYSQAFVDAGAIAAAYSTPEDIGRQAAEMLLQGEMQKRLQASVYPSHFRVSVNQNVAEALGYNKLSSAVLRDALVEFALNCKENYVPVSTDKIKQQVTRR